jgi:hypothetical protein
MFSFFSVRCSPGAGGSITFLDFGTWAVNFGGFGEPWVASVFRALPEGPQGLARGRLHRPGQAGGTCPRIVTLAAVGDALDGAMGGRSRILTTPNLTRHESPWAAIYLMSSENE